MKLRAATSADVPFIVGIEHSPEFREYISAWTMEEHAAAMHDLDALYLIALGDSGNALGYVILSGLESGHRNIELKRVAVQSPGQGHGKQAEFDTEPHNLRGIVEGEEASANESKEANLEREKPDQAAGSPP